jgi:hypothetical protein
MEASFMWCYRFIVDVMEHSFCDQQKYLYHGGTIGLFNEQINLIYIEKVIVTKIKHYYYTPTLALLPN